MSRRGISPDLRSDGLDISGRPRGLCLSLAGITLLGLAGHFGTLVSSFWNVRPMELMSSGLLCTGALGALVLLMIQDRKLRQLSQTRSMERRVVHVRLDLTETSRVRQPRVGEGSRVLH